MTNLKHLPEKAPFRSATETAAGARLPLWPLLLYLTLAFAYLLAIPVGESPDEPGHLQCVAQVAQAGRLPQFEPPPPGYLWWQRETVISGRMCYHMPLYYLLGGLLQKGAATVTGVPLDYEFPPSRADFGRSNVMFDHMAAPTEPLTLLVLRLLSVVAGLPVVWLAGWLAELLFPSIPQVATAAMVLTAGWPQFLFMSRAISNDMLATGLAAAALLVLLQFGRPRRFVLVAAVMGLAVLAKLSLAFGLGVVAAVWLAEMFVYRPRWRDYAVGGGAAVLVWLAFALLVYFNPTLNRNVVISTLWTSEFSAQAARWDYWQQVVTLTLSSGYARFGWMNVAAPLWQAYGWWAAVIVLGVMGLAAVRRPSPVQWLALLTLTLWLVALLLAYGRINLRLLQPQFRFLLTAVPILAALAGGGLLRLGWRPNWLVTMLAVMVVTLNGWLILSVVLPTYS